MALDISKVRVGVTGVIATAALATTAPTDTTSSISAFTDLGYAGEDGITESNSVTVEKIKGWQNAAIVRQTVTEGEVTFKTKLIQTDAATVAAVYGTTVGVDGSIVIVPTVERPHKAFVIDVVDGTEKIRSWIPDGQITELGDIVYQNGEPIGYEITITAFPHASLASGAGTVKKWFASLDS